MQEVRRILDKYAPPPEHIQDRILTTSLNLSMVHNEQDASYLDSLARMLKSFDPGNPNLNIGLSFQDGLYHLRLVNGRGRYNMTHFRLLAGVQHPVANWTPLRDESVEFENLPGLGACIRIHIVPLPVNTLSLPLAQAPQEVQSQQLLLHSSAPTHAIVPMHQAGPIVVREEVIHQQQQQHHHKRDASPKREEKKGKKPKKTTTRAVAQKRGTRGGRRAPTGLLAGLAQAMVGAPNPASSSSDESASSSSG